MNKYSKYPLSYDELTSFDYLYKAHTIARLGKRHKTEVIEYELNLSYNLSVLEKQLKDRTYEISEYKKFFVFEPKKREIQALSYVDRIVQHTICDNYLTPFYRDRVILCNCACQQGKGTHFARKKLKEFFVKFYKKHGREGYVLKCDIKKYFASINHDVLKDYLKAIPDIDVRNILFKVIDSYNFSTNKGLPIGNQTSQILGVVFLDKLDRLVKEKLRIKHYVRYMDDLILVHHDKNYLKMCLKEMQKMLIELDLEFNEKTQIIPLKNGIEFLGGRYYIKDTGKIIVKLKRQSRQRLKRNVRVIKTLFDKKMVNSDYVTSSLSGYKGHLKCFNANNSQKRLRNLCSYVKR